MKLMLAAGSVLVLHISVGGTDRLMDAGAY